MSHLRAAAFVASAAAVAVGCTTILNLEEASPYAAPDAFALADPYPGVPEAGPLPDASAPDASCAADIQNDPSNCGRCGRFCGDKLGCAGGRCAAITLVAAMQAMPNKIVLGSNGRGFFSLPLPTYNSRPGPPAVYCYGFKVYSFDLAGPSTPVEIATPCGRYNDYAFWGIDSQDHVYGWFQNQYAPYNTQPGALLQFGPDAGPDGGNYDAGTPVATTVQYPVLQPDPAKPGAILLGNPAPAPAVTISSFTPGGALAPVLTVVPPANRPSSTEVVVSFDATDAGFGVYSRNSTGDERIWATTQPYDGGTAGATIVAPSYGSICGVRRFGDRVRWCGLQLDVSEGSFDLLLFDLDATTGSARLVNAAAVIPRSTNGSPILPVFYLDDTGVYYTRGPKIDLLPNAGPPVPVAIANAKPSVLYGDATRIYWAEANAIYGVAK